MITNNAKFLLVCLIPSAAFAQPSEKTFAPGTRVSVTEFGAIPNDDKNDAAALNKAMAFARAHSGIVLVFAPGVYNYRDENAVQLMNQAMGGEFGSNPEPTIFKPYYPYSRGLDFRGIFGLTIEAQGATLLCEGWMEPLSIDRAKDVTIRGLTIDYKRRAYSEGAVVKVGKDSFDAVIEPQYPITASMPIPRIMFWDDKAHRMIADSGAKHIQILAPQKVRIQTDPTILSRIHGALVGLVHSMHFRPAILIQQADNIRLDGVTIHSQPGMGIVGHRCSNVTLSGLRVVPAPGSFVSTDTDATHWTSCSGLIRIENSQFEGQGDDAVNIHNYYYSIARAGEPGHFNLMSPTQPHAGVLDYPDVGDSLDLVDAATLEPVRSLIVGSVVLYPLELRSEITLEGDLPSNLDAYYVIDTTRLPKVEIVGNRFLSHRARGLLIKTRNVLIERNLFFENTGTAIHIAAEGGWREGVPSANVIIRENRFIGSGYGAGTIDTASAMAVNIDSRQAATKPLHHGLLIEKNLIDGAGAGKCISISQADDVEIRYNEVSGCRRAIDVQHSTHVNVHDNGG